MKYPLVIFDWDGTLMDSAGKIVACMQGAADKAGLPIPSDHAVKQIIGISLKPAIKKLFGFDDNGLADEMVRLYRHEFTEVDNTPTPLFSGTEDVLQTLHVQRRQLAVATGKARVGLNAAWSNSGTQHYFVTSRCADEAQSKPHPDMLEQILAELRLQPEDAVMVGDTCYDMHMAEQIGMDRIGVSYGVHNRQQLQQHSPVGIVDCVADLLPLL